MKTLSYVKLMCRFITTDPPFQPTCNRNEQEDLGAIVREIKAIVGDAAIVGDYNTDNMTANRNVVREFYLSELKIAHEDIENYRTSNENLLKEVEKLRMENADLRAQVEALLQILSPRTST